MRAPFSIFAACIKSVFSESQKMHFGPGMEVIAQFLTCLESHEKNSGSEMPVFEGCLKPQLEFHKKTRFEQLVRLIAPKRPWSSVLVVACDWKS